MRFMYHMKIHLSGSKTDFNFSLSFAYFCSLPNPRNEFKNIAYFFVATTYFTNAET